MLGRSVLDWCAFCEEPVEWYPNGDDQRPLHTERWHGVNRTYCWNGGGVVEAMLSVEWHQRRLV